MLHTKSIKKHGHKNWYQPKILPFFLPSRREMISAPVPPSTVHINVQKGKDPISILPSSSSTLDSIDLLMRPIHVKHLPLLSDSLEFKGLEIMNWESSEKQKYCPHHGWQVASHWTPFPVLGQRFYICYTCYLALGYVTQGISGPPICWHNTYTVTQPEPKQWRYVKT